MKSEIKNKIIIIESVFLFILIGILIFGLFNKCGTDGRFREVLVDNRELGEKYAELNTENETANNKIIEIESEFKIYRDNAEARIMQLEYVNMEKDKTIMALEKERNTLQDITSGISEATREIRKILSEVVAED